MTKRPADLNNLRIISQKIIQNIVTLSAFILTVLYITIDLYAAAWIGGVTLIMLFVSIRGILNKSYPIFATPLAGTIVLSFAYYYINKTDNSFRAYMCMEYNDNFYIKVIIKCVDQPPIIPVCKQQSHFDELSRNDDGLRQFIEECQLDGGTLLSDAKRQLEDSLLNKAAACTSKVSGCDHAGFENCLSQYRGEIRSPMGMMRLTELSDAVHRSKCVPPPPPIPPEDVRQAAREAWVKTGLNNSTRTKLPIAVIAPLSSYDDHYKDGLAAERFTSYISTMKFKVVEESEAALVISVIVENMSANIDTAHGPDENGNADWIGVATVGIKLAWFNGKKVIFTDVFDGTGSAYSDDHAKNAAIDDAIKKASRELAELADR